MNMFRTTMAAAIAAASVLTVNLASANHDGLERWIDVVNTSDYAVYSVFIKHRDDPRWGRDLLGTELIPPGYEMRVEPDRPEGYCIFDILVVYEDGFEDRYREVNLCELATLRV